MRSLLVSLLIAGPALPQVAEWKQNPATGRWYGVGQQNTTWTGGEAVASSFGGHLATIRDATEQAWLEVAFAGELGAQGLWIGLNDIATEGQWQWSSGVPVAFTNWAPGQPDNGSTQPEDGVHFFGGQAGPDAWRWNDSEIGFSVRRPLIETPPGPPPLPVQWIQNPMNGHFYALTAQMSWTQAESLAQQYGGHLVTIRDAAENAWLAATFSNQNECHWIGLHDTVTEGLFEWASGEAVGYTNWWGSEPNNTNGGEDYAHLSLPWVPTYAGWNDAPNGATVYGRVARGIIEWQPPVSGTVVAFGSGCASPSGLVPLLSAVPGAEPSLGAAATVRVSNLPASVAVPVFVYGLSNTMDPGPPSYLLPLSLTVLGWPGCFQLVSDDVNYLTITNTGSVDHSIMIPMSSSLVGFQYHAQAFVLYSPSGVAVTNGVTATVGI